MKKLEKILAGLEMDMIQRMMKLGKLLKPERQEIFFRHLIIECSINEWGTVAACATNIPHILMTAGFKISKH